MPPRLELSHPAWARGARGGVLGLRQLVARPRAGGWAVALVQNSKSGESPEAPPEKWAPRSMYTGGSFMFTGFLLCAGRGAGECGNAWWKCWRSAVPTLDLQMSSQAQEGPKPTQSHSQGVAELGQWLELLHPGAHSSPSCPIAVWRIDTHCTGVEGAAGAQPKGEEDEPTGS